MKDHLRILFIEDSEDATRAMCRELGRAGYQVDRQRVEDEPALRDALEESWDLIISDCHLPRFDGITAARIAGELRPSLPLLFVSGTLSDEEAAGAMRAGARDFVPKSNLSRLVPAVERELAHVRERARARVDLERARQFALDVFHVVPRALCIVDRDGRVVMLNQGMADLVGVARADDQTVGELLGPDLGHPELLLRIEALIRRGVPFTDLELDLEAGGERRHLMASGRPLGDNSDRTAVLSLEDVTRRRQLQDQFIAMQRLEAVGRLVGGVAHDFNNILSVIKSYGFFLRGEIEGNADANTDLDTLLEAAERGASLISQLLSFSRASPARPRAIDVGDVVSSLMRMLDRVLGEDVRLTARLGDRRQVVKMDPTHLEQILMNLAVNARDAMPAGGQLEIELGSAEIAPGDLTGGDPVGALPGRYAHLSVTDTGLGMPEEIRAKIFEPFFTTKEQSKGTGLGLSTVFGLVSQACGLIRVSSELRRGTTFHIYLPLTSEAAEGRGAAPASRDSLGGSETILLVEDEARLRSAMSRTLSSAGYTVLEAENGADALLLCDRFSGRIDLLVTDLVMPILGGLELGRTLSQRHPSLGILFASGYSGAASSEELAQAGERSQLLEKPFTPAQLLDRVRSVLDAR